MSILDLPLCLWWKSGSIANVKQQVVAIHGGTSFDTHEDYIAFIKTRELTLEKLKHRYDWRSTLGEDLGDEYEVLLPKMPNGTNVRYEEWCVWFERCIPFFQDNVILIGHSLGGIFLAKYLSEHDFPKTIRATILVAAPFDSVSTVESLNDFRLPSSLEKFAAQGGAVHVVHSKDDPIVPFGDTEKYLRALPKARVIAFEDKKHFNEEHFPELVELIRSL